MKEVEERLKLDSDIQAIFYGGSIGSGSTDEFSDIDIRLVIADPKSKRKKLEELVGKLDSILFIEEAGNHYAVIHFESFIKMDLFIYALDELTPNIWLKQIKIAKDTPSKRIKTLRKNSQSVDTEPSVSQIDSIVNKFLAYSSESFRRLSRNEHHYFQHCTLGMKNCLNFTLAFRK